MKPKAPYTIDEAQALNREKEQLELDVLINALQRARKAGFVSVSAGQAVLPLLDTVLDTVILLQNVVSERLIVVKEPINQDLKEVETLEEFNSQLTNQATKFIKVGDQEFPAVGPDPNLQILFKKMATLISNLRLKLLEGKSQRVLDTARIQNQRLYRAWAKDMDQWHRYCVPVADTGLKTRFFGPFPSECGKISAMRKRSFFNTLFSRSTASHKELLGWLDLVDAQRKKEKSKTTQARNFHGSSKMSHSENSPGLEIRAGSHKTNPSLKGSSNSRTFLPLRLKSRTITKEEFK